jgi:hypothetical protein
MLDADAAKSAPDRCSFLFQESLRVFMLQRSTTVDERSVKFQMVRVVSDALSGESLEQFAHCAILNCS